ncbi:MAG: transcription elongation factor GreA [Candidatus Sungbacteria bacterium]|nr:transcription elongation factor GreA [Candidatus Sungbacteria bacterium]
MSTYISQEGLEELKERLHALKTEKRKEIAQRLEHAKTLGDLSENAEYQETKEEQSLVESQIAELEDTLRDTVVIRKGAGTDKVAVGSTVVVQSRHGEETYTIVGSEEASPGDGKISNESPLGKAFLGKHVGDTAEVKTPGGATTYTIRKIS